MFAVATRLLTSLENGVSTTMGIEGYLFLMCSAS